MNKLKSQVAEIAIPYTKQIKELVKQNKNNIVDQVTLGQLYGGMRDVISLVTETSLLDDNVGIKFRGFSIDDIYKNIEKSSYISKEPTPEILFILLLLGRMPTVEEMNNLSKDWHMRSYVPQHVFNIIDHFPPAKTHPMTQLATAISAMETESLFSKAYADGIPKDKYWEYIYEDAMNIIGALPHIVSYIYHHNYQKNKSVRPNTDLDWAGNFAHMIGDKDSSVTSQFKEFMRLYTALHSDHEGGNASAHTCHVVGSTLANPYAAFASAMHSLSGPLHGLATQTTLNWIQDLLKHYNNPKSLTKAQITAYINESLESGRVVPGYGHAVLRHTDPRFLAQMNFAKKYNISNSLLQTVWDVYEVAPSILSKVGKIKNPYPNVDAHSGAMLHSFGFENSNFYTVLFGMSRSIGVMAQQIWDRVLKQPLFRPRSVTSEWVSANVINKKNT
ncbi:Citrate synthase 2 [Candidatus Hepatincola sp. Pdp]